MKTITLLLTLFWIISPLSLRAGEKSVDQEAYGNQEFASRKGWEG